MDEMELVTGLIRAENELRNLKTAHNRGLGTIRLYSIKIYVKKEETSSPVWGRVLFTINLHRSSEPFPLLKIWPNLLDGSVGVYYVNRFSVSNDGFTISASAEAVLPSAAASIPVKIVSTSEIESASYSIVEDN